MGHIEVLSPIGESQAGELLACPTRGQPARENNRLSE